MQDCSIIIIEQNDNSREVMKSYLDEIFPEKQYFFFNNISDGLNKLKECDKNTLIIYDVAYINNENRELFEQIKEKTPKILVVSADCSTNSIIRALRSGAKDFLPKPVLKEDFQHSVTKLIEQECTLENTSKIITVYSNKGGIGKTTIATNLAMELARSTKNNVALIDLNLQLGDVATFLNINPTIDVNYFIKNLMEKDEKTLLSSFERYKDTSLFILSDPSFIEQAESINPYQIGKLFKKLRELFPYIVIDMSANIEPNSLKILDDSDYILFTTIVNIPAIRNCQRCLNLFRSRRYPKDKIKIIINRYMDNDEIKLDDIENTLNEKIYWKIPNNYFTIMEAINKGVAVSEVNPNSNVCNSFREFASKISEEILQQSVIQYR